MVFLPRRATWLIAAKRSAALQQSCWYACGHPHVVIVRCSIQVVSRKSVAWGAAHHGGVDQL